MGGGDRFGGLVVVLFIRINMMIYNKKAAIQRLSFKNCAIKNYFSFS